MSEIVGDVLEDWRGMNDQKKVKKPKKKKSTTASSDITATDEFQEIEDIEDEVGN